MTNVRQNNAVEQQEACQQAEKLTKTCAQFFVTLDPIDWQNFGMRALVKVNDIDIAPLLDLYQRESDEILRRVQIKLFEHAAFKTVRPRPGLKALMWSPVELIKSQAFSSLWVITLDSDERIPITESISEGHRIYEYYNMDNSNQEQLTQLFGPVCEGELAIGDDVTLQEREREYTGKIIYIIPPSKTATTRKHTSRGYRTVAGAPYTNEAASRYVVDCNDGFPHIVNPSQVSLSQVNSSEETH